MQEVQQLLLRIKNAEATKTEVDAVIEKIRTAIKEDPSKGKEFGQLVQSINQALKSQIPKAEMNWVAIDKGALAIGHKPGGKIGFEGMKSSGASVVVTLLQESEGAQQIGDALQKVHIEWVWFPFSASLTHINHDTEKVVELYKKLKTLLNNGHKIYIHCSAGIHRTGMITYGLLRYLGKEADEAMLLLKELREVTASQVGEERLLWANQFVQTEDKP